MIEDFQKALDFMGLTPFVTFKEIKQRYIELSKEYHPDFGGDSKKMDELNRSYNLLKEYIENFRYYFNEDEISKQYNGSEYVKQFRF